MTAAANDAKTRPGGVQSIERVFSLLELMADHGGTMGLSQLSAESGLPLPTIHRLVRTLVDLGYLRQDAARRYTLGPKLVRLGDSASRLVGGWAMPHLTRLVDDLGESANIAMLDGDRVVYVAQAPSRHSMRMFTEVGRRVMPHCTAVGKAMLAQLPEEEVLGVLRRTGMPRHTDHTLTEPDRFLRQLAWCAEHGYALDEEEQEVGVRCVAVPVAHPSLRLAISVSGPAGRVTEALVQRAVPLLRQAAGRLSLDLA